MTAREYIEAAVREMDERPSDADIEKAIVKLERYTDELRKALTRDD